MKFIQFQPWKECNNKCKFCYASGTCEISKHQKIENLHFILNKILEYSRLFDTLIVGLIGGEFFDGQITDPEVKKTFFEIIDLCGTLNKKNKIAHLYLATSLIFPYSNIDEIITYMQIKNYDPNLLVICTSYDLKYRFHTFEDFSMWETNVLQLKHKIKNPVHIEIILSQFFIEQYINGQFRLDEFKEKYSANVDFIEPLRIRNIKPDSMQHKYISDFFLKRADFIKFLKKSCIANNDIDISKLLSMSYHSDILFTFNEHKNEWLQINDRNKNNVREFDENGNKLETISYIDSMKKIEDDVNTVRKVLINDN